MKLWFWLAVEKIQDWYCDLKAMKKPIRPLRAKFTRQNNLVKSLKVKAKRYRLW